tara:strand:- start:1555 stop:2010 length:456 start_codon:yes stop_codon:yes gene_type:complete
MIKNVFLIFIFFIFVNVANAKQIRIVSDKLEILRQDNISIFSGNVYAEENNLEIWSQKLTVLSNKDQTKIKEINAQDDVRILKNGLSVTGNNAKYHLSNNTLIVIGQVKVMQNENIILCDEIVLDLTNSSSIVKSHSNKRVEALIISEDIN